MNSSKKGGGAAPCERVNNRPFTSFSKEVCEMGVLVLFSLILSLCCLCSGEKDVKVGFGDDGYTFDVYIDGDLWFRSGKGFVGVWDLGIWWSNAHKDTHLLKLMHISDPVVGSDSIGQYEGTR